jgi:hypothetical protein
MKKKFVYILFILQGLLMVFSCSQDAIFFKISQETAPVKPRIAGTPTNMVEFDSAMYVASGNSLWRYDGNWSSSQPGGKDWITFLAVTTGSPDYLYALFLTEAGGTVLRRTANGSSWGDVRNDSGDYPLIQTIYAGNGQLFAGAGKNSGAEAEYGILYLESSGILKRLEGNTGLLSGAASGTGSNYYLSTRVKGVYKTDLSDTNQLGDDRVFMGMIKLEDNTIIMVERDGGAFYKVKADGSGVERIDGVATGKYATGALALWNDGNGKKMLTAGIQGGLSGTSTITSFSHGYVELSLTSSDGSLNPSQSFHDPSITVDGNTERYNASLGKYPIHHMHQAASNNLFFASTQSAGLWSYKNRTGGMQWNAED